MIRILYTINNLDTAGSKFVLANLVRGLDREKFQPRVAVGRLTGAPLENELKALCPVEAFPLHLPTRPRRRFPAALLTTARKLRGRADLAHSLDYSTDWTEGAAMRLAGIPWVTAKTNLLPDQRRRWLRSLLSQAIVCLSEPQANLLPAFQHKIAIIPVGVDMEHFQQAQPLHRVDYGYADDDVLLACVAHLVPVKGHPVLFAALASIAAQAPRLKLLLVGTGEFAYEQELRQLAQTLGLTERVRFLGNSNQVAAILKMCDGNVLPTLNSGRRDAFPAAVIEAMAAGRPVIATRSGGAEEIMRAGETGWLVAAGQPGPLAEALCSFYSEPEKRRTFGAAGQARAQQLYDRRQMVARHMSLYESILA